MPIAIIIVAVIAVIAAAGFFLTKDSAVEPVSDPVTEEVMSDPEPQESEDSSAALPVNEVPAADDPAFSPIVEEAVEEEPAPTEPVSSNSYPDGTYIGSASYFTPKNTEHDIDVTITISDDVITAVDVKYDGGSAATPRHSRFEGAFEGEVVGVELDDVSLSRTGGASLTSDAFNEAVTTIKQKASS